MTNNKHVEPYIIRKQDKKSIDGLKCDLLRRIALRNGYQKVLGKLDSGLNDMAKTKLTTWIFELNNEIWMGIKHGYRFPLFIEAR